MCLPPYNDPMNRSSCVTDPLQCWHMYCEDINWWEYKNYSEMPACLEIRMVWKLHQCNLSHWISSLGGLKSWAPFSWIELTGFLAHIVRPLLCASVLSLHQPNGLLSQSYLQPYFFPPYTEILEPNSFKKLGSTPLLEWKQARKCDQPLCLPAGYLQGKGSYTS